MKIFIGLAVENELKRDINIVIDKYRHNSAYQHLKWTKPDNLHSTLFFIGETDASNLPLITEKLQKALKSVKPFTSHCEKLIALPSNKYPHVLAYELKTSDSFIKLAALTRSCLNELDFKKPGYHFLPHITIARIRSKQQFKPIHHFKIPTSPLDVNSVIIYESKSWDEGVRYIPLERFML